MWMVNEFVDVSVGSPVVDPASSTRRAPHGGKDFDAGALEEVEPLLDVLYLEPANGATVEVSMRMVWAEEFDAITVRELESGEVVRLLQFVEHEHVPVEACHLVDGRRP
jgi:hypothetical protein